jgi:SNF2 family DNA or RNA helicase
LRNRRSKKYYGAKQLGGDIKWFVTGTPVQNSDSDFISLLLLLGVGVMYMGNGDWIKHYVLGRTKKSVGIEMPNKTEHDIPVLLTPVNGKEYNMAIQIHDRFKFQDVTIENVDRIIAELFEEKGFFALLTAARQCCILPEMISRKAFNFAMTNGLDFGGSVNTHTKLTAISKHITDNKKKGLKLVFTHYRDEIDRLKLLLARNGITSSVLDGRTKSKVRKNILKTGSFRGYGELALARTKLPYDVRRNIMSYISPDVLLVQIKSGCEGLNLQSYSEVYFTSPHWNPAVEDQAVARAHRIGQTKNVNVYRFITKLAGENTISLEEYCRVVQARKRELMDYISSKAEKL